MIYRKRGTTLRWEHGVFVHVTESGEAREIGEEFVAEPRVIPSREDGEESPAIRGFLASLGMTHERLIVSEGRAHHEYGDKRWSETTRRVHVSLVSGTHRALVDLAEFDAAPVARIAAALARVSGERVVERVRLAENVTAALLPSLIGTIEIEQMPADHDGYGEAVERRRVEPNVVPPNFFRPSYRLRPVRAWHNLRAIPFGTLEEAPRAIALLAPPEEGRVRLLCVDGDDVFAAEVGVGDVRAVGEGNAWYPYGAGAFGAEMLL